MDIDLLSLVESGGCSAKLPAIELEKVLKNFPKITDPNLLVDIDTQDDAAVYKISENQALIFTTDFFPPICSDPFEFGQIAAANSLSDVYAMGGKPILALNIAMKTDCNTCLCYDHQVIIVGNALNCNKFTSFIRNI